jgi:hypothetical protein
LIADSRERLVQPIHKDTKYSHPFRLSAHRKYETKNMRPRLVSFLTLLPVLAVSQNLHWSFLPVQDPELPSPVNLTWARNPVDRFILSRLEQEMLQPAPEADRVPWLRRVYLDLTGLPPSPEQLEAFVMDTRSDAHAIVVDELLASPRYGERWAQPWLDVVRYADTHGFEVNTERPNAWPYRDYVIRAFNEDRPYDQFIREQLAGDAFGEDAATGFLVTASVLLPGQIGKDAPSIRLARQDALDEIVVNVGQTFLGLSVGCARCHDHMFDPISQTDYYAMQAFFAGVAYGERTLRTPEAEARRKETETLMIRVREIDQSLAQFAPLADVHFDQQPTSDPTLNLESFTPLDARFVRFTIHDANTHPTLGLIEPCIDELEIFTDEATPRNVALASNGTKVTVSGSRASRPPEQVNDGQYGDPRGWISDEKGRGWVQLELPELTRINQIQWGRDRTGRHVDRLAIAYTLEAGPAPDQMTRLVHHAPARPPVNARQNTDRFAPVKTQRLRFTILQTNSLEPCIDELEVFDTHGRNRARTATITSSGDTFVAHRHELRQINDGAYGNQRSWMSNEDGKGWVEIDFHEKQTIDRVVWGRDREGKYSDRLATGYQIEIVNGSGEWVTVAGSMDRQDYRSEKTPAATFSVAGLNEEEAKTATRLLEEKHALEARIKTDEEGQKAFAGSFRAPDVIHVLYRGDPEQPREEVAPAMLHALSEMKLAKDTPEQERRIDLARWISDPTHPLTARVMVNRIWQGHFGTGLVSTPSDFGKNGTLPSHPELLDWLSAEFIRSDWSVKHLHRLITCSSTYRQSNRIDPAVRLKDGDDRLLARFPSRRLEAEVIRDAIIQVSGRLNLKMYGRGFDLFDKRGGLTGFKPVESFRGEGLRRMIYAHKVRRESDGVFGAFDCPDAGQSTARRAISTTPIQALNLFNSRFILEASEALATRAYTEAGEGDPIQRAWLLALGRKPTSEERADAEALVASDGLPSLGRALFNTNEFLFMP